MQELDPLLGASGFVFKASPPASVFGMGTRCDLPGKIIKNPPTIYRVHRYVYNKDVRRRELENSLRKLGWWFLRHGNRHDVWTDGNRQEAIPRHRDINEKLAQAILKRAGGKR